MSQAARTRHAGFSLIELMIVVAIIGVIAAIAIPGLLAARIRSNEAAVISDSKALCTGTTTYLTANGAYPTDLPCMAAPTACAGGVWPAGTTPFLDAHMGCLVGCLAPPNSVRKQGYDRTYTGAGVGPGTIDPGVVTYTYFSDPTNPNNTGTRYFTLDQQGLICVQASTFGAGGGTGNPVGCIPVN